MNTFGIYDQRHLSEVTIERFKAAFKPGPIPMQSFNVVIGANGSGKSTLIEALQWLDNTIRRDARDASDRYFGVHDLINLRSRTDVPYFQMKLVWASDNDSPAVRYRLKVEEQDGNPYVAEEELVSLSDRGRTASTFIETRSRGERLVCSMEGPQEHFPFQEPDRLALIWATSSDSSVRRAAIGFLSSFWSHAVFLRLSPARLAQGSPAKKRSFEPLLDEEGQNLPALLNELTPEQKRELVLNVREILPGIRDVEVLKTELGRDTRVNYSLLERMPYRGRAGRYQFAIPAWMLSEGTRRITAILALLAHEPAPSLLCIEEIENGLDPQTVIRILQHLQSAADRGTQVVLTTHSPWLLDHVPMESILRVRRVDGDTKYEQFSSLPAIEAYDSSVPAGTRYVNEVD
jgi:predicted ATPase